MIGAIKNWTVGFKRLEIAVICGGMVGALGLIILPSSSEATGMLIAYKNLSQTQYQPHESRPVSFYRQFVSPMQLESKPRESNEIPRITSLQLPESTDVYQLVGWSLVSYKRFCFTPENSLFNIKNLTKTGGTGILIWPQGYQGEPLRCAQRQYPVDGLCENGSKPSVPPCDNMSIVVFDFERQNNREELMQSFSDVLTAR